MASTSTRQAKTSTKRNALPIIRIYLNHNYFLTKQHHLTFRRMHLTIIRSVPELEKYTPLSTHQSQTPASFSIPVLHFRNETCKLVLAKNQTSLLPIFGDKNTTIIDIQSVGADNEEVIVDGIDIWVTSENFILYNPPLSVGVELPYTSITLHAIQRINQGKGIYMQVALSPSISQTTNNEGYDDDDILELTAIPQPNDEECTDIFFKALSDCANLNPDPGDGSSDDEIEAPIMFDGVIGYEGEARLEGFPGETGWITAENVDQFQFDDVVGEGGFTNILGPGAGTIRPRDDEELGERTGESGGDGGGDETKWRRVE